MEARVKHASQLMPGIVTDNAAFLAEARTAKPPGVFETDGFAFVPTNDAPPTPEASRVVGPQRCQLRSDREA
jgi:hypothetical protein